MNADDFLHQCPSLWHIGPNGSWEGIKRLGFRTAEQLIRAADLDEDERTKLLTEPRAEAVTLTVDGGEVILRGQGALHRRAALGSPMRDGRTVADSVAVQNRRLFLYADRAAMTKALARYIEAEGAQEVVTFSPLRFINSCRQRIEVPARNAGAVALKSPTQQQADAFTSLGSFPSKKRPSEVTVIDGIDDLAMVAFVERHLPDGTKESLAR